jgi:hypothetical protein
VRSLELAYCKYQEIIRRLKDGTHVSWLVSSGRWGAHIEKEYEDLERHLSSLTESCRTWSRNQLLEIQ